MSMKQQPNHSAVKRKRGRPQGSAPNAKQDKALLCKAANLIVRNEHLKITVALRELGKSEESDLARLRKRWQTVGDEYIAEARANLLIEGNQSSVTEFVLMMARFSERVQEVAEAINLGQILGNASDLQNAHELLRQSGKEAGEAFDTKDPLEVCAAFSRLEGRDRDFGKALIRKEQEGRRPTEAEKKYIMAVLLHETALEELQAEKRNDTA